MRAFVFNGQPSRVVFGVGALDQLGAEIERLGARRALVLSTPEQQGCAEEVSVRLGARSTGVYAKAVMHVPIETAEAARAVARELQADCCVAIGGGSTIGLGKAIALTSELPILAIPTTFAGSEMTPIYGITAQGQKKTGRDARVLPKTVVYDPNLLRTLPAKIAGPSGSPLARSHSRQVARWLVRPTAATRPRSYRAPSSASPSSSASQIRPASCSCQSGAGTPTASLRMVRATTTPLGANSVQRTESEPASIARMREDSAISFWILDFGFWIERTLQSKIQNPKSKI